MAVQGVQLFVDKALNFRYKSR